ncbi:MAG: hypothetical protein ACLSUW_00740 [Akkermansia sp.]
MAFILFLQDVLVAASGQVSIWTAGLFNNGQRIYYPRSPLLMIYFQENHFNKKIACYILKTEI